MPSSGKGCVSLGLSPQTEIFGETEPVFSATCSPTPADHILGHKANLGKFKKTEIIPSIFSDHNAVRLDLCSFM